MKEQYVNEADIRKQRANYVVLASVRSLRSLDFTLPMNISEPGKTNGEPCTRTRMSIPSFAITDDDSIFADSISLQYEGYEFSKNASSIGQEFEALRSCS